VKGVCLECQDGLFLKDGKCVAGCSLLCVSCNSGTFGDCRVCASTASLVNGECIPNLLLNSIVSQDYFTIQQRPDLFSYSDNSPLSTINCYDKLLAARSKTVLLTLGNIQSYSAKFSFRLLAFSGASSTLTLNFNGLTKTYSIPAASTLEKCPGLGPSYTVYSGA
jgi:hypothetical protein